MYMFRLTKKCEVLKFQIESSNQDKTFQIVMIYPTTRSGRAFPCCLPNSGHKI